MKQLAKIGRALILIVVFLGLFVADGLVLGGGQLLDDSQQAQLIPWWVLNHMKFATARYDANGNLTGCDGPPKDCIIFVASSASIAISTSGAAVID